MLKFLTDFLGGIFGWLANVLPNSPIQDVVNGFQTTGKGIAWLNWFVPVGDFLLILGAFLAVLLVWAAVTAALNGSLKGVSDMVGGSK